MPDSVSYLNSNIGGIVRIKQRLHYLQFLPNLHYKKYAAYRYFTPFFAIRPSTLHHFRKQVSLITLSTRAIAYTFILLLPLGAIPNFLRSHRLSFLLIDYRYFMLELLLLF